MGVSFFIAQSMMFLSSSSICCRAICICSSERSSATRLDRSSILSSFLLSLSSCFFFTATAFSILSSATWSSADVSMRKLPSGPASSSKKAFSPASPTMVGSKATTLMGSTGSFLAGEGVFSLRSFMSSSTSLVLPSGALEQQRYIRHGSFSPSPVNLVSIVMKSGGYGCGENSFGLTFFFSHFSESGIPFFGSALFWNCGHQVFWAATEKVATLYVSVSFSMTWCRSLVTSSLVCSIHSICLSDASMRMSAFFLGPFSPSFEPIMYFLSKSCCFSVKRLAVRSSSFFCLPTSDIWSTSFSRFSSFFSFFSSCFKNWFVRFVACLTTVFMYLKSSFNSLSGCAFFSSCSMALIRDGVLRSLRSAYWTMAHCFQ
mmetsp:Transcript_22573/g.63239  ORF Transcript_22573/g.63239 Transcript_22573/m.63239 type:complete len:373 (-) Transcript_22573:278-1396(-)